MIESDATGGSRTRPTRATPAFRTFVRLKIKSKSFSAPQISEALGLKCDKSGMPGAAAPAGIRDTHGWILNSGLAEDAPLDEHTASLLRRLSGVHGRISALSVDCDVVFSCAIYCESADAPALHFEKSFVSEITKLGASLDIDLYFLNRD
ncbi:DUF4279 domain-containing protein [Solimonas sp. K1W22B-7]|uniref:DUF4279 domain-containing protein n=1 Tax=Solimonas sp. K1W22B-7 TaxID=2303331 RepID=UPI000E335BCB|nr:DUF4279 domain-containing protein [Solimonas sp. K1W22B-7]